MEKEVEVIAPPPTENDPHFKEFILKVAGRCNLNCDYCYMYELADQGWRDQPRFMSDETVAATAQRIGEHVETHDIDSVLLVGHGGEPLLKDQVDPNFFPRAMATFRDAIPGDTKINWAVQTNGTLLDEERLDRFQELGIRVGVSVDGDQAAHDQHRKYHNGKGSFDDVRDGLQLLQAYPDIYSGIITVTNLESDSLTTYNALRQFKPPSMDFLLPLGNWTTPPPGRPVNSAATPYADWLIPIFDQWHADPEANKYRVRTFVEIMRLLMGRTSRLESIGLSPPANAVVATNGEIEDVDSLKSTTDGLSSTGLSVHRNSFDEVLQLPRVRRRLLGAAALSLECLDCDLVRYCGGGLYAHRYKQTEGGENSGDGSEFRNRSVYCPDLMKLIGHIAGRIGTDIDEALVA